jgi:serine/threonine protein phosphatase 1
MSVFAVSDLHGQFKTFAKGLETIGFSDSDVLYVIGDVIDRGPDGIKLLQYIREHDNMDLIIGNHEFMMLNSVPPDGGPGCDGVDSDIWLFFNGGIATYEKYGNLTREQRKELLDWLAGREVIKPLEVNGKRFCLTHSFYCPGCENKRYSELTYDKVSHIVWDSIYRDDDDSHAEDIYEKYDYTFVSGHVPVQRIYYMSCEGDEDYDRLEMHRHGNLLCIDGGCAMGYNSGVNVGAIFLRLDDLKEFPVPLV